MPLPAHLFASEDGALYDTRAADWSHRPPVRACYRRTPSAIASLTEVKAALRAGGYAWPGGYPLYFITADGAALSFEAVRQEFRNVADDFMADASTGWRIVAVEVNWEDGELTCDHTGEPIPSAYAEDSEATG